MSASDAGRPEACSNARPHARRVARSSSRVDTSLDGTPAPEEEPRRRRADGCFSAAADDGWCGFSHGIEEGENGPCSSTARPLLMCAATRNAYETPPSSTAAGRENLGAFERVSATSVRHSLKTRPAFISTISMRYPQMPTTWAGGGASQRSTSGAPTPSPSTHGMPGAGMVFRSVVGPLRACTLLPPLSPGRRLPATPPCAP